MPDLSRAPSIPIGQIGRIRQEISPRAEEEGIGPTMVAAARSEFGAAAQEVATGVKIAAFGAEQAAIGEQLLKPFKQARDFNQRMQAEKIATDARLKVRADRDAMLGSGVPAEQWEPAYNKLFNETYNDALNKAKPHGDAALAYVHTAMEQERLSIITDLRGAAIKEKAEGNVGVLDSSAEFEMKEAIGSSDPVTRQSHQDKYYDLVDAAVATNHITDAEGVRRKRHFTQRLREESGVQIGLRYGLQAGFNYVDSTDMTPIEKDSLKDKIEDALRFDRAARETKDKAAEKQLKIDQATMYTTLKGNVLQESNTNQLVLMIAKAAEYEKTGVIAPGDGRLLVNDIEQRIKFLTSDKPDRDNEQIATGMRYRIITDPLSVTPKMIDDLPAVTYTTKGQLHEMLHSRQGELHFSKLPAYKESVRLIKQLDIRSRDPFAPITQEQRDMGEAVERASVDYERRVQDLVDEFAKVGKKPSNTDLQQLDSYREELIKGLKTKKWSAVSGPDLKSFTK